MKNLIKTANTFPKLPGVYQFKDAKGRVLYVGKAKNLRSRISSYFKKGRDERPQIEFLIKRTSSLDFIVTDTEKEALLLENTLIKEHRPRYNIHLRDDKSYVSIRIGEEHAFPGICLTRQIRKDGAIYYGPYDSSLAAREAVDNIIRFFRLRSCSDTEFANRVRPCLKFDIGRCTAPCVDKISKRKYLEAVQEAKMFLSGKSGELVHLLKTKMANASKDLDYEEAAKIRDAIAMLKGILEKQKVVKHGGGDRDVIGVVKQDKYAAICLLKVRRGALIGKKIFIDADSAGEEEKIIEEFLLQFYKEGSETPAVIAVSKKPKASADIASIISDKCGKRINLVSATRGELLRLTQLAETNATEALNQKSKRRDDSLVLENLGKKLHLKNIPCIIECLDISNLQGKEAIGSLVTFVDGAPEKSLYRIYNIRTLDTPDDYGMMNEVLERRFSVSAKSEARLTEKLGRPLPDLLLVDGGKGQLNIAKKVLDENGLEFPVAAIAKAHNRKEIDRIFIPGRKNPLNLKSTSKELLFLMRIRDEAHRFGIKAHRKLHSKKVFSS